MGLPVSIYSSYAKAPSATLQRPTCARSGRLENRTELFNTENSDGSIIRLSFFKNHSAIQNFSDIKVRL